MCTSAEQMESHMVLYALDNRMQTAERKEKEMPLVVSVYRTQMNVPVLHNLVDRCKESKISLTGIILVGNKVGSQVRQFLETQNRNGQLLEFQIFHDDKLVNNPTRHEPLQPRFRLLSAQERKELGKHCRLDKLDSMEDIDIIAQYYGAHVGDVFEIRDMTTHLGEVESHRIVIQHVNDKKLNINKVPLAPKADSGSASTDMTDKDDPEYKAMFDDVRKFLLD